MIHKLDDAGDIELLKNIIDFNRKQEKSRRSTDNTVDSNDNTNTANGDTSIDLSFSEKESTNMSKKQDKANQKERTRENIDKIKY